MKALLILLLLSACAAPPPVFKPVDVDMPVPIRCAVAMPTEPDFALGHTAPSDDVFTKTKAALIELDQRKAFEAELESQLALCR